ncbi:MAG TPA: bifunctional 4-hydroxy-3-methylbut-2-enyl diphosphate reductase/30S ribosomal protein S1 [Candidatus Limnocylindria bacterium]|nr:bifunctional 4-hydroxy-3-methylbut-2-enyl diphosphate reductase/30S ribosomal protein S1 [Candidatus Limnocylindria bacterium]
MPVEVAAHAGFCSGVARAVTRAMEAAKTASAQGMRAFSLGELIHNPAAVQSLREQGLVPVEEPEDAAGGMLVIRSHGVSPEVYARCELSAGQVVDCTCPLVHHVQKLVEESSGRGVPVIILGDPEHPEIRGIRGWCRSECRVVQDEADVASLPDRMEHALVVCQTTLAPSAWDGLAAALLRRFPGLSLSNTICGATNIRQAEAEALAKRADRMVVVGGAKSANTRKLAETCRKWCPETYLVEGAADLKRHRMDPSRELIGITAGASTPAWSLKEVVDFMYDQELNGQAQNPQEPIQEQEEQQAAPEAQDSEPQAEAPQAEPAQPEQDAAPEAAAEEPATEPEAQPAAPAPAPKATSFMDEVAASIARIRNGQTVTGKIVQITDDEVSVNIGYKSDGLLKRGEMVDKDARVGDEIEVEIVKVNDGEGNVILSQRNIVNRKVWNDLMEKYHQGELVEGVGKEAVKGGLLATVDGVRAFIPASHLSQRYVEKITQFVGQKMKLKIIEVDESKKRVVASRKEAMAQESAVLKDSVWGTLEEGAVVRGTVRRFTNFGAFVDLGGVDGLIHVSDLSWNRSAVPSEVLQVNQEVEVKILSLDRERERIALGYKQLQARPWDNVVEKYPVGTVLNRKVVRLSSFGAFVELEHGVDGLVHISQVAPTRVEKIEDVLAPGQEVAVKVLAVDPVAKRISLSIREAMEDSALNYSAEIPGEGAEGEEGQDSYQQDVPSPASYGNVTRDDPNRQETSVEAAMRRAREELEANASRNAGEETEN